MNTIELQKIILEADLLPTEKLIGMAFSIFYNKKTGYIRIRQQLIADKCGVSVKTVKRAVSGLKNAGIFDVKITGRSSIIYPHDAIGNIRGRVEGSRVTHQRGHSCPYNLDIEYSTLAEEKQKRAEKIGV